MVPRPESHTGPYAAWLHDPAKYAGTDTDKSTDKRKNVRGATPEAAIMLLDDKPWFLQSLQTQERRLTKGGSLVVHTGAKDQIDKRADGWKVWT